MQLNPTKRKKTIAARIARDKAAVLEQLKKTPIIQIACERAGIARSTVYRWIGQDKEFAKSVDQAILQGTLLVNDVAESQLMAAIRERNITAIIFWLRHRHDAYKARVEVTANITNQNYELTPEQRKLVQEALRLAALPSPGGLAKKATDDL